MLHIILKGMDHRAPDKHIFCPYTHPQTLGWVQNVKTISSESSHAAYQLKGMEQRYTMQGHIMSLHTPTTIGMGSTVKTFFCYAPAIRRMRKGIKSCPCPSVCPSVRPCVLPFVHHLSRYFVSATPPTVFPNPFETLQVFLSRTEDVHDIWI